MTTYLAIAGKLDFQVSHIECQAIGQVEILEGKYRFTRINLYPKIYLGSEELRHKAELCMKKAQRYCLVGQSVSADIFYHPEFLIGTATISGSGHSAYKAEILM